MRDEFNPMALDFLKCCHEKLQTEVPEDVLKDIWIGRNTFDWFEKVKSDWVLNDLPKEAVNRHQLLGDIQESKEQNPKFEKEQIRKFIVKVFAWGRMRTAPNGKSAIRSIDAYEDICRDLALGRLDNISAYDKFYRVHNEGIMRGVGPPYYTKLIYFLGDQSGLIMDQWTARSVNLLSGRNIVRLSEGKYVSAVNDKFVYEKFLSFIYRLTDELGLSNPAKTEELIFSTSYKKKNKALCQNREALSAWRRYVDEQKHLSS